MSFDLSRGKCLFAIGLSFLFTAFNPIAASPSEPTETMELDVIEYDDFVQNTPHAIALLNEALYEKGIVGIRGVPGYRETYERFLDAARAFTTLPEEVKERSAPDHSKGETFLGYESGKEKFQLPDGRWVIDNLKVSYYALNPDVPSNKWPAEVDLNTYYSDLTSVMSQVGIAVMEKIGLIGEQTGIHYDNAPRVCRMLYYKKSDARHAENPYWCGAHFDHCLLTGILPAFYFCDGVQIDEPPEAGLFIRTGSEQPYKKIIANDYDVMMFQVGEFGQLATNDKIRATEHRVHKAFGEVERYTMAAFFNAPMDAVVHSTSVIANDERYGAAPGEACTFEHWHLATFNRYIVKDESATN